MLGAAGTTGAGKDWAKIAKSVAGVASPLSMLAGPEMAPIAAGLAAYAGSGKNKKKKNGSQGQEISRRGSGNRKNLA